MESQPLGPAYLHNVAGPVIAHAITVRGDRAVAGCSPGEPRLPGVCRSSVERDHDVLAWMRSRFGERQSGVVA